MYQARLAANSTFKRGADEVGFEFGCGEACSAVGEGHDATIAARRVCECNDGCGVEIGVWREVLFTDLEPATDEPAFDLGPIEPQMIG